MNGKFRLCANDSPNDTFFNPGRDTAQAMPHDQLTATPNGQCPGLCHFPSAP